MNLGLLDDSILLQLITVQRKHNDILLGQAQGSELIVASRQSAPAGITEHKYGHRLPLFSARPAVT